MTVPPIQNPNLSSVLETKSVKDNKSSKSNGVFQWCVSSWRAIFSEFVATCILVLVGCMSCIPLDNVPYQSPLYAPLAFGFIVSINVQIFGPISGAHMNPAVTLAALLYGSLKLPLAVAYFIAQTVGAVLGYGILMNLSHMNFASEGICVTHPHQSLDVLQILGIEIVLTTCLNLLNCSVWDPVNKHKSDSVSVKFGLAIAGLSLAGGPWTGASMNPVRSLGPAVWTGRWTAHWVYWVGPLLGAVIPVAIYKPTWYTKEKTEQLVQESNRI